MDPWLQRETKLVEYAKVEASTRPVIAKCLKTLEEDDQNEIAYPAGQHRNIMEFINVGLTLFPRYKCVH